MSPMSRFTLLPLLLSTLSSFALASDHGLQGAHTFAKERRADLVGPSTLSPLVDPFYKADSSLTGIKPGTILKSRQVRVTSNLLEATYQALFVTSSPNGTLLAAVTTVFVPPGAPRDRFVLSGRPDNSINARCAVSWRYTNGSTDDDPLLQKKWIVTSVDHEGPDAAFGAGRLQGQILLDAGRAVQSLAALKFTTKTPQIVINGYSGGAGAAAWGASLAASYAPDLNIVAAAYGGTPVTIREIALAVDGGNYAGMAFLGAFGMSAGYSALANRFNEVLTPAGQQARLLGKSKCLSDAFQAFANEKLLSTKYTTLGANLLDDAVFKPIFDSLVLGAVASETPKFPMFVYHAGGDQIIPVKLVDAAVSRLCANGANLLYSRTSFADHFSENGIEGTNVGPFFDYIFNKKSWPSGCRTVDKTFTLDVIDFSTPAKPSGGGSSLPWPFSLFFRSGTSSQTASSTAGLQEVQKQEKTISRASKADIASYLKAKVAQYGVY